jgi:hypothetical protein
MWSLSNFMKSLKQRFSSFYNRGHERTGTLWEERYRSIIVEGEEKALLTMALYIDLNPIRAGLVTDPADYRFCGYAEAIGGGQAARAGLASLVSWTARSWRTIHAEYRRLLYSTGEETSVRKGFTREETAAVEEREGQLPAGAALRHRIRYLSEGVILGSRGFIDSWLDRLALRKARDRERAESAPARPGVPPTHPSRTRLSREKFPVAEEDRVDSLRRTASYGTGSRGVLRAIRQLRRPGLLAGRDPRVARRPGRAVVGDLTCLPFHP